MDKEHFLSVYAGIGRDYPVLRTASWVLRRYYETARLLEEHCPRGRRIVDVGAWPGTLSVILKRDGWDVIAIDKAPYRPATPKHDGLCGLVGGEAGENDSLARICEQEGMLVRHADIEREALPLETGSADAVIFTEVIEHLWFNPLFALSEVNRILKPQVGVLILSTPNFLSLRNRLNFLSGRIHRVIENPFVSFLKASRLGHLGHLRLYSPDELLSLLTLMGFQSRIEFDWLYYGDQEFHVQFPPPSSPNTGAQPEAGTKASAPERNGAMRWLSKRPSEYGQAVAATLLKVCERVYPQFRPQIHLTAVKATDADYQRNHADAVRRLVEENYCPSLQQVDQVRARP